MAEPRRIRPPQRFDKIIDLLTEKVFETKQAAMMFAAAVGYRYSERKALDKPGEGIRWSIFEKNGDDGFINALAIAEKGTIDALDPDSTDENSVACIFEEYATGGFEYIENHVVNAPGDILENCLALVQHYHASVKEVPPGLQGLDPQALELLGDLD